MGRSFSFQAQSPIFYQAEFLSSISVSRFSAPCLPCPHRSPEYGESHQNLTNKLVHWVCVPLIMFSLLGLLWSVPAALRAISPWLNLGTLVMLLAMLYYLRLSVRLSIGMVLVWAVMAAALRLVDASAALPLWAVCLIVFVVAWIGSGATRWKARSLRL
jgi:uncharacterized membrane protein YGL010W